MFNMFIHYHTKCSHIKIHLITLLLFLFLPFGVKIETSVTNYQMCVQSLSPPPKIKYNINTRNDEQRKNKKLCHVQAPLGECWCGEGGRGALDW